MFETCMKSYQKVCFAVLQNSQMQWGCYFLIANPLNWRVWYFVLNISLHGINTAAPHINLSPWIATGFCHTGSCSGFLFNTWCRLKFTPWRQEEIGSNGSDSNCGCVLSWNPIYYLPREIERFALLCSKQFFRNAFLISVALKIISVPTLTSPRSPKTFLPLCSCIVYLGGALEKPTIYCKALHFPSIYTGIFIPYSSL